MRILIVEDDPLISMVIEDELVLAGHEIVGASASSSDARRILDRTLPDLMLVDIHLVDGETGCMFARETYEKWKVPTIFVTGSADKARTCDEAIGVLTKPFDPRSIAAAVAAVPAIQEGKPPTSLPAEFEVF